MSAVIAEPLAAAGSGTSLGCDPQEDQRGSSLTVVTGFMLRWRRFVEISSRWSLSATFPPSETSRYDRTTHLKFSEHYGLSLLFYLIF